MTSHGRTGIVVALVGVATFAGCGGSQLDSREYTEAETAVTAAEVSGAAREPNAALHLQLAREQIARAEELMQEGEEAYAHRMLDRAQVDAELAMALAVASEQRTAAVDAQQRVMQLRQGRTIEIGMDQ